VVVVGAEVEVGKVMVDVVVVVAEGVVMVVVDG
jgi:hypothetical protein